VTKAARRFVCLQNQLVSPGPKIAEHHRQGMPATGDGAAAESNVWEGRKVPANVYAALTTKWRGQSGIAKKQSEVLDFFDERAVLRDTDQTRMTAGGGSEPPSELSAKNNVATEFRINGDDRQDRFILAKYGQINPTRMIKHVLSSKFVSDEAKHALCTGRKATECVTWLQEFNERQRTRLEVAKGGAAVTEAELASLTPAERKARQRQQILDERVVHSLSAAQITAVHFALCTFFFICRIPFVNIEHWAFILFVKSLNPAYVPHLFKRTALSTTWLTTLRAETEEKTESFLGKCMGRKTIIIDGFKDRRGRHVMNISDAKVCD